MIGISVKHDLYHQLPEQFLGDNIRRSYKGNFREIIFFEEFLI
jgi:hypothetical protein